MTVCVCNSEQCIYYFLLCTRIVSFAVIMVYFVSQYRVRMSWLSYVWLFQSYEHILCSCVCVCVCVLDVTWQRQQYAVLCSCLALSGYF